MDNVLETVTGQAFTYGQALLELSYLIAAILFVVGLKLLSHPESARRGNFWAASGMILAMITTLLLHKDTSGGITPANAVIVIVTIAFGSVLGFVIAKKVKMTAMPQLVSFFNATGGAASALVALLEYPNSTGAGVLLVTLLG
jgi:NAD(P) transhydrogenase subunit beta